MLEITWSVKGNLDVLLQSFSSTSIYRTGLQKLSIVAFAAIFSNSCTAQVRMRRNGYLWISCVNFDTAIRLADPDFLLEWRFGDVFCLFLHFICWMSAIFLLLVCLTYWRRKYTTRVDPQVDNSHQVLSWHDHPLPSYSVFVCWYVTWPGDLDLWPFDL